MGSISASGTGFAARTRGWARSIKALALSVAMAGMLLGAAPPGRLDVDLSGLRNGKGDILVCVTRHPDHFPDCTDDPDARTAKVPAASGAPIAFLALPSADYAVAVIHDENRNEKLDTFARIPREGFGFSRNPAIRFGPPRFDQARFPVAAGDVRQDVKMRYIL